jgi:hypothetical protein
MIRSFRNMRWHLPMKTCFCTLMFFFCFSHIVAQFKEGWMMMGGNFDLRSYGVRSISGNTSVKLATQTRLSITPQFGYFLADKIVVGGQATMAALATVNKANHTKSFNSSIVIGPFARYYYQNFYGQLTAGIGNSKEPFGKTKVKYGLTEVSLGVGYALFFNHNIAIEPILGYRFASKRNVTDNSVLRYSGLFLKVGLQVYLDKI